MKKKGKQLLGTLLAAIALTVSTGTSFVSAAAPSPDADVQPPAAETPAMPESYELEIQSNNIPGWPQGPKVIAETAILMDADSGEILYAKGIDEKRAPASTTKIMTAMLAIEKVPLDTKITFTDEVNNIESDSTHIGIKPGETLTMEDSLYAILIASANEVSSGVAEYIGGTVPAFVEMMNQRAKDLGCENTHFVNANGLYDENHYTTARDLALISKEAFKNETYRKIIKTPYYIIPTTNITDETRWLNNHHKMILDGPEHYDGCLGGKTGYTVKANNTLVTYAERNDMRLICVILNDVGSHYDDTRAILDYGFGNFQKKNLSAELLKEDNPDSFISHLKEQGLLTIPLQNICVDIPKEETQEISCRAAFYENALKFDCYYGKTLLNTLNQEASQEVLDAFEGFDHPETIEPPKPPVQTPSVSDTKNSLGGFKDELFANFKNMPNWKYAALGFLVVAFIFYIILLIIKVKRSLKKHKQKKPRKKTKRKKSRK